MGRPPHIGSHPDLVPYFLTPHPRDLFIKRAAAFAMARRFAPYIGREARMIEAYLGMCFLLFNELNNTSALKVGKNMINGTVEWFAQFALPDAERADHAGKLIDVLGNEEVTAIRIYIRPSNTHLFTEECYHEQTLGDDASFLTQYPRAYIYDASCAFTCSIRFTRDREVQLYFVRFNPQGEPFAAILGPMDETQL